MYILCVAMDITEASHTATCTCMMYMYMHVHLYNMYLYSQLSNMDIYGLYQTIHYMIVLHVLYMYNVHNVTCTCIMVLLCLQVRFMSLEKEVFPYMAKEEDLYAFDLKGLVLTVAHA